MKIYNWGSLLASLFAVVVTLWQLNATLTEWNAMKHMMWAGVFALHAARSLRAALKQGAYEQDKARLVARKRASQAMFGQWAPLMECLSILLILPVLPLLYLRPEAWKLGLALLLGAVGYQLWLNVTLRRRVREQENE